MANMGHCRFSNTGMDLQDCINDLQKGKISSKYEKIKAIGMFELFLDYCCETGIIEEYDEELVSKIVNSCVEE